MKKISGLLLVLIFLFSADAFHAEQLAAIELPGISSKDSKQDEKYAGFMEKKLDDTKRYIDMKSLKSARSALENAEKYHSKISIIYQKTPKVLMLKKRMDSLSEELAKMEQSDKESAGKNEELLQQKINIRGAIKPYLRIYSLLNMARSGEYYTDQFSELDYLKNAMTEYNAFGVKFRKDFALLIQTDPDYQFDGITPRGILETLDNSVKYRDAVVENVCGKNIDRIISFLQEDVKNLQSGDYLPEVWLSILYGPESKKDIEIVRNATPYYKWIGKSVPAEKLSEISSIKNKMRSLLESKSVKHKWEGGKYPVQTSDIKSVAAKKGKAAGLQLVAVGMTKEWKITKNALGIPLRRSGNGYVIYRKNGEPFLRGYRASFDSIYNGKGYEPVSVIVLDVKITPHR